MYTAKMSPEEIDHESYEDMRNVIAKMKYKQNDFRRLVLKTTHFPVRMKYEQNTVRKNRWVVSFVAWSKRNIMGKAGTSYYSICESEKGKFIYCTVPSVRRGKGFYKTVVFKPHFFSRYRERMGLEEGGEKLIDQIMSAIVAFACHFQKHIDGRVSVIITLPEGFCFGESYLHDEVILIRTFVPARMFFDDQKELHEAQCAWLEQEEAEHLNKLKTMTKQDEIELRRSNDYGRQLNPMKLPNDPTEFMRWMRKAKSIAPEIDNPDEDDDDDDTLLE